MKNKICGVKKAALSFYSWGGFLKYYYSCAFQLVTNRYLSETDYIDIASLPVYACGISVNSEISRLMVTRSSTDKSWRFL